MKAVFEVFSGFRCQSRNAKFASRVSSLLPCLNTAWKSKKQHPGFFSLRLHEHIEHTGPTGEDRAMRHLAVSSIILFLGKSSAFQAPSAIPLRLNLGASKCSLFLSNHMSGCFAVPRRCLAGLPPETRSKTGGNQKVNMRIETSAVKAGGASGRKRDTNPLRPFFDKALRSTDDIIQGERDAERFFQGKL